MSLLLLLRPKYVEPSGGLPHRNNSPWLSFNKDDQTERLRRRRDEDDVLMLVAL